MDWRRVMVALASAAAVGGDDDDEAGTDKSTLDVEVAKLPSEPGLAPEAAGDLATGLAGIDGALAFLAAAAAGVILLILVITGFLGAAMVLVMPVTLRMPPLPPFLLDGEDKDGERRWAMEE